MFLTPPPSDIGLPQVVSEVMLSPASAAVARAGGEKTHTAELLEQCRNTNWSRGKRRTQRRKQDPARQRGLRHDHYEIHFKTRLGNHWSSEFQASCHKSLNVQGAARYFTHFQTRIKSETEELSRFCLR